jgi:RNA polymerase sigma-70 factor (ECF subfamily)
MARVRSTRGADAAACPQGDEEAACDLELVRRAQAGDEEAFAALVNRNRRAVYRAAYAALGSADEADDVAQEAFVAAFQKLGMFRGEAAFRTWLVAIAWRKALDRRRSVARWLRRTVSRDLAKGDAAQRMHRLAATGPSQEDTLTSGELDRTLKRLIATLPVKLRDTLLLARSGDYSYEQIGGMLGIPTGSVKWRVSEARRVLRAKLAALGYDV